MSLFVTSLNSGSNGNCYYVGNGNEAIFVDAGISCKEIEKRMLQLGLNIRKIKALFISHEHSDHIRGIEVLSKRYQLPVYITEATLKNSGLKPEPHLIRPFHAYKDIRVGALHVTAFPKFHDAADPHSFVISSKGINVGVFTDIGAPCEHVIQNFKRCNAVFLEANYDTKMLDTGSYPYHLKQRIRNGHGHLSNAQALEIFTKFKTESLSHIFLSHLSKENNDPRLVENLFLQHAGATKIAVASRYEAMQLHEIIEISSKKRIEKHTLASTQMALF